MAIDLVVPALAAYAVANSTPESALLQEIREYTYAHVSDPDMLSGPLQGRVLSLVAHLIQPKRILEIGTYTGYATLCMAEGLRSDGQIITLDKDPKVAEIARQFFARSPHSSSIIQQIGPAADLIQQLDDTPLDLVFIDADKTGYLDYYQLVRPRLRACGLVVADNVLWSGKVLDDTTTDADTLALQAFAAYVHADSSVENVLLPIRDGLLCARKIH